MRDDDALVVITTALQLPATATPVSLTVATDTPYADWERIGVELRTLATWSPWAIGDWYLAGETMYGEEAAQAVDDIGLERHTVQNAAWVCSRFEPGRRVLGLSFSHHGEVAAFPPELADAWLAYALANGWSRADLRNAIREARREQAAEDAGEVLQLPPPIKGRGLVEVNAGMAYIGMQAVGDLIRSLEGHEVEYTFQVILSAADEEAE